MCEREKEVRKKVKMRNPSNFLLHPLNRKEDEKIKKVPPLFFSWNWNCLSL